MRRAEIDYAMLNTLVAPIAQAPVEICMMFYLRGPLLAAIRHVRGLRGRVELPLRLFVADALAFDADGAIMAHNHPSGDATASRDDIAATIQVARAFDAVRVTLIEHLVVAGPHRTSLREKGHL